MQGTQAKLAHCQDVDNGALWAGVAKDRAWYLPPTLPPTHIDMATTEAPLTTSNTYKIIKNIRPEFTGARREGAAALGSKVTLSPNGKLKTITGVQPWKPTVWNTSFTPPIDIELKACRQGTLEHCLGGGGGGLGPETGHSETPSNKKMGHRRSLEETVDPSALRMAFHLLRPS
ncbi:hypothetical protein SKAU_G00215500 [Synaphobranchus kaupii]|uniref:Uncharacterized protein n=1 Tax=Synaphobranchus kaupii TaxID=118154 RepID=A0A9Q1FA63_SYNKA|nr:hypothetical protein SKAU_G00215500 [Synaphobranchus kaupii]